MTPRIPPDSAPLTCALCEPDGGPDRQERNHALEPMMLKGVPVGANLCAAIGVPLVPVGIVDGDHVVRGLAHEEVIKAHSRRSIKAL